MCCKERKLYCKVRIIVNLRKIHESKITDLFLDIICNMPIGTYEVF
jgi:hypothetical protein